MPKDLSIKQRRIKEDTIYCIKQQNHLTAEIIKVKRMIEVLGDNEIIISHLASLEHMRDYYLGLIKDGIELLA